MPISYRDGGVFDVDLNKMVGGTPTIDYSTDASDVARMRAGRDLDGAVHYNPFYGNGLAGAAVGNSIANTQAIKLTADTAAQQAAYFDTQEQQRQLGAAAQVAHNPLPLFDGTNSAALNRAQRVRAAQIPGGSQLLSDIAKSATEPIVTSQNDGGGNPLLLPSSGTGKAVGANRVPMDLINDPRFMTLMGTNPENAKKFYTAITGRDFKGDIDAHSALITDQTKEQNKVAADLQKDLVVPTEDDQKQGLKKGEAYKRLVGPGLYPGAPPSITYAPLTDYEKTLVGYRRTSDGHVIPSSNSAAYRATGVPSVVNRAADAERWSQLKAKEGLTHPVEIAGHARVASTGATVNSPTIMDKVNAVGNNVLTTGLNLITHPIDTVAGYNHRKYSTASDMARLRAGNTEPAPIESIMRGILGSQYEE